jgi:hypothetical protein
LAVTLCLRLQARDVITHHAPKNLCSVRP